MDDPVVMLDIPPKLVVHGFWVGLGTSQILIWIKYAPLNGQI